MVVVPCGITARTSEKEKAELIAKCQAITDALSDADLRVEADLRDHVSPGWKFNHWELKGVPLRLEVGPRDMAKAEVVLIRRDNGEKKVAKESELLRRVQMELGSIHEALFAK